jgi:predicted secreted Zn-dependent protease
MVDVAARSVRGLKIANDRTCFKTRREMKRLANAAYAEYEARQTTFDRNEHKDGGNIDRQILALIKAK